MVRVIHPFPVTVVVGTSLALLLIAHRGSPGWSVLVRACFVVLLSQIAVGALNDVADRHLDAISQPEKPIPQGLISTQFALGLVIASLFALVPLALSFGPLPFWYIILGTGAGVAYDLWLKPTLFSLVGYLVGFMALITWIWTIAGKMTPMFAIVYPAGSLLLAAAHLAQSFPDIESDKRTGRRGLAMRLGTHRTFWAIVVPLFIVGLGGLVLSVFLTSLWGAVFNIAALALALRAALLHDRAVVDRATRVLVFYFVAPSIALVVLGSLIALTNRL